MYCVAASRCGWRLKHALNPSRNRPNRRSSARAGPVVTHAAYRTHEKSTTPWITPPSRTANQPDKVVLSAPGLERVQEPTHLVVLRQCVEPAIHVVSHQLGLGL